MGLKLLRVNPPHNEKDNHKYTYIGLAVKKDFKKDNHRERVADYHCYTDKSPEIFVHKNKQLWLSSVTSLKGDVTC